MDERKSIRALLVDKFYDWIEDITFGELLAVILGGLVAIFFIVLFGSLLWTAITWDPTF